MEDKTKGHSPLPWTLCEWLTESPGIDSADEFSVVHMGEDAIKGQTAEQAIANTALIVKAVNERDGLIAALEALCSGDEQDIVNGRVSLRVYQEDLDAARAALKEAQS